MTPVMFMLNKLSDYYNSGLNIGMRVKVDLLNGAGASINMISGDDDYIDGTVVGYSKMEVTIKIEGHGFLVLPRAYRKRWYDGCVV